jgi:glycosyltransferase involved in cell wall biosynthesis
LPSIGVVTPSYQQGAFIERTIASVIAQEYPRLTYVVQDGGSTDETLEILRRHEAAGELTFESAPDGGQVEAINRGFERIDGDVMGWLNSDDLYLPGALVTVGRYFRDHPDVDVVYGHRIVVDSNGGEVGRWVMPPFTRACYEWRCYVPQESMFWRRSAFDAVGGRLDESFEFAMDWDLAARMAAAGASFRRIPRFLGGFTTHPAQKSLTVRRLLGEPEFATIRRRQLPTVGSRLRARTESLAYLARSVPAYWRHRNS